MFLTYPLIDQAIPLKTPSGPGQMSVIAIFRQQHIPTWRLQTAQRFYKTVKAEPSPPAEEGEEFLVWASFFYELWVPDRPTDRRLSRFLGRSVQAIQQRRWCLSQHDRT